MFCAFDGRRRAWYRYPDSEKLLLVFTLNATGTLPPVQTRSNESSYDLIPLANRNGYVNPEDLIPMPQCIAQQDQAGWLSTMARCTSKQCTRHFGVICTHHQWLTQLSCLSTEFSPEMVGLYLPVCSRSVLAKAQLFHWIHNITGRMWLVNVGDANGLQSLSPLSLTKGYAAFEVTGKAPTCLTESVVDASIEPFEHVIASCAFTSDTRHTGNADRPWEYRETLRSIVALDTETVGYELTGRTITRGDYFDKRCFCDTFSTHKEAQLCPGPSLASTKERLWLNATCGPDSLPADWTKELQTTAFAYIAPPKWRWPQHKGARSKKMTRLVDHCTTDACDIDSDGYCKVERAVDRACICRNISYDNCEGPCRDFEARIDFVNWLHDLCGNVEGWHGLPKHWRQLTVPTSVEMIPWRWELKPFRKPDSGNPLWKDFSPCVSTEWKLGSVILVNLVTLLAGLCTRPGQSRAYPLASAKQQAWILSGLATAAIYLLANLSISVHATVGYETLSVGQLMLLLCSMPRLTWSMIFLRISNPSQETTLHMVASFLVAETILQTLSAFPMIQTINYGIEHKFYDNWMARLQTEPAAQYMYAGAVMWLIIIVASLALLLQVASDAIAQPEVRKRGHASAPIVTKAMDQVNKQWTWFEEMVARKWVDRSWDPEREALVHSGTQDYGTLLTNDPHIRRTRRTTARLTIIIAMSGFLLWVAQWFFWSGFITLSAEGYVVVVECIAILTLTRNRFCPPKLYLLTAIWVAASIIVTKIWA
ncbi:hypothetical protein PSPO01_01930 [Paraphaeosphaeria sporulosa]